LWINGKKRGRRKKSDFTNGIIEWSFEYTTGNIEVKGFNKNKEECSYVLKTAGKACKIKLNSDKNEFKPGEIAHIEISVTDKDGNLSPDDKSLIELSLEGDAVLLGVCSGDLNQNWGFNLPKTVVSQGRALAIIKAGDMSGKLVLNAYSEELENSYIRMKVKKQHPSKKEILS